MQSGLLAAQVSQPSIATVKNQFGSRAVLSTAVLRLRECDKQCRARGTRPGLSEC